LRFTFFIALELAGKGDEFLDFWRGVLHGRLLYPKETDAASARHRYSTWHFISSMSSTW
jgi:hypothetical protein